MNAGAVRPSVSSTVGQWCLTVERAHAEQADLEAWLFSPEAMALPLHEVEREQERHAREAQRLLLQAHLQARGSGDVGPALEVVRGDGTRERHARRRTRVRHPVTVFGEVAVRRLGYGAAGAKSIHPLDEEAALPGRSYSYELQRRLIAGAVQGPFDEAIERVKEATGVLIPKRSAEIVVREAAADFEAFYDQRAAPGAAQTGPIVVASVDCKGIPMVKPEKALRVVRRGRGEKANKKRMATVAAVFTQQPRPRTPQEVVESLFRSGPRPSGEPPPARHPGPEHKRVWASVEKDKDEVIGQVVAEVSRRDPQGSKRRAVVTDGERALQHRLTAALPGATVILDLLHVLERLWKAAYCFHPEGSEQAAAWVRQRTLRVLRGEVGQVVKGIRRSATVRGLTAERRRTIHAVTGYLYRNRSRMRYHEYLRDGLPIASGSVEGACKNLIKDRMERSGMRWTIPTAEAMVKLRAVYLSGDRDAYWHFHINSDQERIHPKGRWHVVEK